ncbi:AAA family ATPase [Acinetobacter seifertii]|nr:AAA family ATPase [Acinetobacter seifertii]
MLCNIILFKNTPKIFAIDNIDASLNPKMCRVLIELLIKFAKKYDKQVFVTTHNPAILDGLNLYDEEQALFVVSRNSDGHTKLKRMNRDNLPKEILDSSEALRLSEAFIRGYLGGLPKNF